LAVGVFEAGRIYGWDLEYGAVWILVVEAVGGFESNLGLADAAEAFNDGALVAVGVRTGGILAKSAASRCSRPTKPWFRLRGTVQ